MEPELLGMLTKKEQRNYGDMTGQCRHEHDSSCADHCRDIVVAAFRSLAEARQDRDDWKATYEAAIAEPQLKLLADKLEWAEERAGRAEAQVAETRREGCAAIGTLENVFNGLTSPDVLERGRLGCIFVISAELAKRMAEAAANTLATAERCEHKAERDAAIADLRRCMEALERAAKQSHLHRYQEAYEQAAGHSLPLLLAKLQAAVEMEKALQWILNAHPCDRYLHDSENQPCEHTGAKAALLAWQQAGEEIKPEEQ